MQESHEEPKHHEGTARQEGCMCGGCGPITTRYLQMLLPSGDAGEHFRKARLEMLKGFRALLDQRIESLSGTGKGTKINVE